MDPLSVSASIIGILAATGKVTSILFDLTQQTRNAPKSIHRIKDEVEGFRTTVSQLQEFVLRRQSTSNSRYAMVLVDQLVVVLTGCVLTFSELEVFVTSLRADQDTRVWDRIRWVTKSSAATDLLARVQNHKLSIVTMMTVLDSYAYLGRSHHALAD